VAPLTLTALPETSSLSKVVRYEPTWEIVIVPVRLAMVVLNVMVSDESGDQPFAPLAGESACINGGLTPASVKLSLYMGTASLPFPVMSLKVLSKL
jgi:hypothetical protein